MSPKQKHFIEKMLDLFNTEATSVAALHDKTDEEKRRMMVNKLATVITAICLSQDDKFGLLDDLYNTAKHMIQAHAQMKGLNDQIKQAYRRNVN